MLLRLHHQDQGNPASQAKCRLAGFAYQGSAVPLPPQSRGLNQHNPNQRHDLPQSQPNRSLDRLSPHGLGNHVPRSQGHRLDRQPQRDLRRDVLPRRLDRQPRRDLQLPINPHVPRLSLSHLGALQASNPLGPPPEDR